MAQAIISPLLSSGELKASEVFGVVGKKASVQKTLADIGQTITVVSSADSSAGRVWNAPIKLLAVKPQHLDAIKEECVIRGTFSNDQKPLMISIIAGVKLTKLESIFPSHNCVRAVPNTPSIVRAGLTGLAWGDDVSEEQRASVARIFDPISEVFELPEEQLDAFLALTSSGPAYVDLILEALADGAVAAGLPRTLANHLANRTLAGSVQLAYEKKLHSGELKDMVASPGGTTIAALRHLEMAGIRSALIEAVFLAAKRSRELG